MQVTDLQQQTINLIEATNTTNQVKRNIRGNRKILELEPLILFHSLPYLQPQNEKGKKKMINSIHKSNQMDAIQDLINGHIFQNLETNVLQASRRRKLTNCSKNIMAIWKNPYHSNAKTLFQSIKLQNYFTKSDVSHHQNESDYAKRKGKNTIRRTGFYPKPLHKKEKEKQQCHTCNCSNQKLIIQ